jgi:hypothetical protein
VLLGGAAELAGELLAGQRDPDEDVAGPRAARLHIRIFNMIPGTPVLRIRSGSVGSICLWASCIRIRISCLMLGSGSFHHLAKIVRKTLIPTVL